MEPISEPAGAPELVLTGERTLPGIPDEAYWFERHLVAYDLAADLVDGKVVLDAGCGEGYGLAEARWHGATRAIGVDNEAPVVAHVQAVYGAQDDGIEAIRADLADLPLEDDTIDVVVSFQVIEHLHDVGGYLAELRRVTRPGGRILIATPNRITFTPGSDTPVNPFHIKEYAPDELREELAGAGLVVDEVRGVHHGWQIRLAEAVARRPFTDVLTSGLPHEWPRWVRRVVHRVKASWFAVHDRELEQSLDLVAFCTVPGEAA